MKSDIVIVKALAATPVGFNSEQTSASVRAGIVRFGELSWQDRSYAPFVMSAIPDDCLPELHAEIQSDTFSGIREKRIIRIAGLLREEIQEIELPETIPFILGLPDIKDMATAGSYPDILKRIEIQTGLTIDREQSMAIAKGRASGLTAIRHACKRLESGKVEYVLAGGCDSYKDIDLLSFLDLENRVKTESSNDYFIPGEGVGLLLLTTDKTAKRDNLDSQCRIVSSATGFEEGHYYSESPYKGEGLFNTFQQLFLNYMSSEIQTVYSSMNGESHWAKEWGVSRIRFHDLFAESSAFEHPADCYGDLGAASGPVMTALATTGLQRGYKKEPVLVYASSDDGERAALILEKNHMKNMDDVT